MAPERLAYGPGRSQRIDLYRPAGPRSAPVIALLHGGYWRARYGKALMAPMAAALADHGWAVANIEYRRVGLGGGGGGWPATFDDVAAAVDHLAAVPGLDPARVVTVGHSAGGHLALWAAGRHRIDGGAPGAAPSVTPVAAIALAGVVDLARAAALGLGAGAVPALMGGLPADVPDRYAAGSPAA
ncbi:MAG TPA: alpha/beta hydrolase, partial [Acidimicrobiales bacterium]|nr:alpha/beta hydrolase [Acidimicrobiales bacterium]